MASCSTLILNTAHLWLPGPVAIEEGIRFRRQSIAGGVILTSLLVERPSTIGCQGSARHIGRFGTGQEKDGARDFHRIGEPLQRVIPDVAPKAVCHGGVDHARADAVDTDPWRQL